MALGIPQDLQEKIWSGHYGPEDIQRIEDLVDQGILDYSTLASVLYSYASHLEAAGDRKGHDTYLIKAVAVSDMGAHQLVTAEQYDVRQTILRDAGRYEDAKEVIDEGLKIDAPIHTKALLMVGKADALSHLGDTDGARTIMSDVAAGVDDVVATEPRQAIRIYRALVRFYKKSGNEAAMNEMVQKAYALILKTGANDQRAKLEYDMNH